MRTLDNDTSAALPAHLRLTRRAYARYFARTPQQERALYRSTFVPYWVGRRMGFGRAGTPHWLEVKEHVEHGCLCPAKILDVGGGLIATFTNLNARGERSFPAVKVRREPVHLLPAGLAREGVGLACTSIFHASAESWEEGQWVDFTPLPVDCLVTDVAACEAARSRLSSLAWQALTIALAQLDGRFEEGLHRVEVPHEIVWNAF